MNSSSPHEWPEWNGEQQVVNCQNLHHNYERKAVNRERATLIALFRATSEVEHSVGIDSETMRTFPLDLLSLPLSHSAWICSAPLPHICIHEYSAGRAKGTEGRVCSRRERPSRNFLEKCDLSHAICESTRQSHAKRDRLANTFAPHNNNKHLHNKLRKCCANFSLIAIRKKFFFLLRFEAFVSTSH